MSLEVDELTAVSEKAHADGATTVARPHRTPRASVTGLRGLTVVPLPSAPPLAALPAGLVPRRRLLARLHEPHARLALIAAPAGYGKTTLLGQWARDDDRPFAWLTIERTHDAGLPLIAAIEQALDNAAPVDARSRRSSMGDGRQASEVALGRLVRSLSRRGPFVLVIDDIQTLHTDDAHEVMRTLIRHIPPGCRLALSTRSEPPFLTARLRANRELTEIRASDLAMTSREGADLLAMAGLTLSDLAAGKLTRKLEGWPVGLYLAAMALRDHSDPAVGARRFGGEDPTVASYLRDEVLSPLSEEAVSFLIRTSILECLSVSVCDALLKRRGSGRLLSSLRGSGQLLVPVDRNDDCYRCHGPLRQTLLAELRRTRPEEVLTLHRRASDFYAEHNDIDRAIHHAVSAGDPARAAVLLGPRAPRYVTPGSNDLIGRWLSRFTPQQISTYPGLALAAANLSLLEGQLDTVQAWEASTRRALQETPSLERSAAHEASVKILHAAVGRDGITRMGQDAAAAYALEPEDSPWRPLCCLLEGVAHQLTGAHERAEARLAEGARRGSVTAPNIQTLCLAQLALGASERADWQSAAGYTARAMTQIEHYELGKFPSSALVFAASALVHAHRGRIEEAQNDAGEATRLLARLTDYSPWYEAEAKLALAAARVRLGNTDAARDLLADASQITSQMPEAVVLGEWVKATTTQVQSAATGSADLTTAELRILTFLPTHLSFREIGDRLYVSVNTVKAQAHAVYRKLDVVSRSEAVDRAIRLGLLDA